MQLQSPSKVKEALQVTYSLLRPSYNGFAERYAMSAKNHLCDRPKM